MKTSPTLEKLKDPKFYLENFTSIKGKKPGALIPFILNEAQKDLFNTVRRNSRVIILKSRQMGFSTAMVGYFYHDTVTNPGTTTAIIGYNSDLTSELLDKVKTFYRTTPASLKPTIQYNSKYEISFPRLDSKILVLPSTVNVGRGYTLSNVLATELSAWENAEDKMMTLEASVPINGKLVIESTPAGVGNLYHRMWMSDDNDYAKKEYGWWWGYCLDEETEILTVDGWKKRKDFKIGDRHFTVNLKTKKLEIKKATDKFESDYKGLMIHFKSFNLDMLITPNHKCVIQECYNEQLGKNEWKLKQAKDIKKNNYIPLSTLGWFRNKKKRYKNEFVELLGWIISEGTFEPYTIRIYQNIGDGLDRIENLCRILELKYTRAVRKNRKCGEIRIHSKFTKEIRKILNNKCKNLPINFLLKLTHEQLVLLQRTMIMADGHIDRGGKKTMEKCDCVCTFVQKDKTVSENFQMLTVLVGRTSSLKQNKTIDKCFSIRIKKCNFARRFLRKYEEYDGKIWCPTNDNGTIIIRRNGKVMITGQSKEEINIIRKRMNNPTRFAQEYGCEFLASGRPVFDPYMLREQRKNIWKSGEEYEQDGKTYKVKEVDHLRMYKEPEKDGIYSLGADVSEGVEGGDYSVATIWDRRTGEEVAMFRGLISPDRFADKLYDWGMKYNKALMVVEINNHGLTTLTCLKQKIYPSLYFRPKKIDSLGVSSSDKFGWKTTKVTRPLLIDEFAQACRDREVTIHSKELIDEMTVFVYDDSGNMVPQSRGFHDDCIFSAGIAWQGFKLISKTKLQQLNYSDHLPTSFAY